MKKLIMLSIVLLSLTGTFNTNCGLFSLEAPAISNNPMGKSEGSVCSRNCDCHTGLTCEKHICQKPSRSLPTAHCPPILPR